VKVYLDSGVFIDYLIDRGHTASYLRSADRRGRAPARLLADAQGCFSAILDRHQALTSSLTCYEVEEAMYGALHRAMRGIPNAGPYIIPAARAVITQTLVTIERFKIELVDLTSSVVTAQCSNLELQTRGIRAADALHVTTALAHGADVFVSTDSALIALDRVFPGTGDARLRCLDTDDALVHLR
jgi:predicted nucleic acid-binding protein